MKMLTNASKFNRCPQRSTESQCQLEHTKHLEERFGESAGSCSHGSGSRSALVDRCRAPEVALRPDRHVPSGRSGLTQFSWFAAGLVRFSEHQT
jgi:hypothetical protein